MFTKTWKKYSLVSLAIIGLLSTTAYFTSSSWANVKPYDNVYSCTAPDGSCSASISCSGPGGVICGTRGRCTTFCRSVAPILEKMSDLIVISTSLTSTDDVQTTLSLALGAPVTFIPTSTFDSLTKDDSSIQNMPLKDFLSFLTEYGEIRIDNVYVNNLILLKKEIAANPETKFSFNLSSNRDAAKLLEFLTGRKVELKAVAENSNNFVGEAITVKELANKLPIKSTDR
jgi:hypothetical protein